MKLRTSFTIPFLILFTMPLLGCAETPLFGRVLGLAAPVPVMLGPIRCIGECAPEPSVKHEYEKNPVSEMSSRAETSTTSTTTSTSSTGTTVTQTTTTTSATDENSEVVFASPLMAPLVQRPLSRRVVVQLRTLDLGRALDTAGAGTNNQSSLLRLLVTGSGYAYALPEAVASPAPAQVAPKPSSEPTTPPPAPTPKKKNKS